jgi:hypothetical protein
MDPMVAEKMSLETWRELIMTLSVMMDMSGWMKRQLQGRNSEYNLKYA